MDQVVATLMVPGSVGASHGISREFNELVRSIGDSRTRQEEERIMQAERTRLKAKIGQPNVTTKQMREYLVRVVYLEMLGLDASFGYIHAVNMAQKGKNPFEKRVGYLAVSLLLHEDHELTILLVQTILRDLRSANYLDICSAMTALCRLLNADLAPAVYPAVIDKLNHPKEIVRKKALMCLLRFYKKVPSIIVNQMEDLRRALADSDPSVMGAALAVYHEMIVDNPAEFTSLVPVFVALQRMLIDRKAIHRAYDYHDVPAPWLQIRLLRILAHLGADNATTSEGMYPVLLDTLKRAATGVDAAYAVLYETIATITTIYPNTQIVGAAAETLTRFLSSSNSNLRYLGMTALAAVVKVDPTHAAPHQMVVIDCLESADETLRRKTLDVLYRMTNAQNVSVIVAKMIEFLRNTVDEYLRTELVSRITLLAQKYAPSNLWFTTTMATLLEIGGDLVRPEVADSLMRLVAEGSDDAEEDGQLRAESVHTFLQFLGKPHTTDPLLHTAAWVLGEYGYLASDAGGVSGVLTVLSEYYARAHLSQDARCWLLSAMMKLVAQAGQCPPHVAQIIARAKGTPHSDLTQRAAEFDALVNNMPLMRAVLPVDASCEDIEIDETLSFADAFVNDALRRGASRYLPPSKRAKQPLRAKDDDARTAIRFEAYEAPKQPFAYPAAVAATPTATQDDHVAAPVQPAATPQQVIAAAVPESKRKWGKEGNLARAQAPPQQQQPVSAPTQPTPQQQQQQTQQAESVAPAQSQATATSAAAAAAAPRVMTEKERMAAALFSGIVPNAAAPAPAPVPRPRPAGQPAKYAPPQQTQQQQYGQQPQQPVQQPSATDLLFSLDDIPAAAPAPQRSAASSASLLDGLDLLDLGPSSSSPLPPLSATSSSAALSFDPLMDLLSVGSPSQSSSSVPLSTSNASATELAADYNLSLSYSKRKEAGGEICVSISLTSLSRGALRDLRVSLDVPPVLTASLSCPAGPSLSARLDATLRTLTVPQLPALSSAPLDARLRLGSHRPVSAVGVSVSYTDAGGAPRSLQGAVPVGVADFVRPLPMVTAEFGQRWVAMSQEAKASARVAPRSAPKAIADKIVARGGLHLVEIIRNEVIFACTVMSPADVALVHARVDEAGTFGIAVRSDNKGMSENVAKAVAALAV